jgi:predicted nucleic acid-binding protein
MNSRLFAFDSCTILHLLSNSKQWLQHIKPIYDDAVLGRVLIVVSEISIAEVSRLEPSEGKPIPKSTAEQTIRDFFNHQFIRRRAVTSRESELATKLILAHGLGTCDGIIAATAAIAGAEILFSSDGCAKRRKAGKLLTVPVIDCPIGTKMKIKKPDALEYSGFMLPIQPMPGEST